MQARDCGELAGQDIACDALLFPVEEELRGAVCTCIRALEGFLRRSGAYKPSWKLALSLDISPKVKYIHSGGPGGIPRCLLFPWPSVLTQG